MRLLVSTLVLFLGLCCSFSVNYVVNGDPDTDITNEGCNPTTYSDGDAYGVAVKEALNNMFMTTPFALGYNYSVSVKSNGDSGLAAFAYGNCEKSLMATDCSACMIAAYNDVTSLCNGHMAGWIGMVDCFIGYLPV
ncbi:OLC1v1013500C1 [Oldenlandia corymbosa var. corymbosa]|uniref:OLC1v1013500C1 n=1 Tax=Oldenlandia corymbosa var. corymbosa TaxID=529605 RepID=A0AAV1DZ81_OLDCO|nr:OLC1v1013500C1 [Oldenlandia corymbosa var. corymbosa]